MRAFNILGAIVLIAATLAGCKRQTVADVAPPQATDVEPTPQQTSLIAAPSAADAAMLQGAPEPAVPPTLRTIARREKACVTPQRLKICGRRMKITPPTDGTSHVKTESERRR